MRLPTRHLAPLSRSLLLAALLALPPPLLLAQRYDSMSAQEFQRRLERDTDDLINELRSRRNTPLSRPTFDVGNSTWAQELRTREERKKAARDAWLEQQRRDAEWARDHPGETREQYYSRIDREIAARNAERQKRLAEKSAAQVEQFIALQNARLEMTQWAEVRRAADGYAARTRPPVFKTGQEALAWLTAHDREIPNQWAAVHAAILLIDGANGVLPDPAAAARLVDPRTPRSRPADDPIRPEFLALHAYLRATHPQIDPSPATAPDRAGPGHELEKLAGTSGLAKWLLARLLAASTNSADQTRALALIGPGYTWARDDYDTLFGYETASSQNVRRQLDRTLIGTLGRLQARLPEALEEWPLDLFRSVARLLAATESPPAGLLSAYTDAIAGRLGAGVLGDWFDYFSFGDVIAAAGRDGSGSAHALATLDRFRLLETGTSPAMSPPSFRPLADMTLAIPALTRWAAREDPLGARARLALVELVRPAARDAVYLLPDSPEGQILAQARTAVTDAENADYAAWQKNKHFVRPSAATQEAKAQLATAQAAALAALKRREHSAPPATALPRLLATLETAAAGRQDLAVDPSSSASITARDLAIDDPSFDLPKAAALLDAAFLPGFSVGPVRNRLLAAAARLGDAYAPHALALQPDYPGDAAAREALKKISRQRRARDEAARLPRALLANAIDALLRSKDATGLLADAARAGSPLAAALQLDQRIGSDMSREPDRPPSWNLDPALIARFDAEVTALHARPNTFTDWTLVHALGSPFEAEHAAQRWLDYLAYWDLDRQERLADDALAKAIQPQINAILATLALWPGINQGDPLHAEWTAQAERNRELAQESLRRDDGLAALRLFLAAAGRGDRGALELLGRHLRNGDGSLPRSASLADQIQAAALRMTMTDAEVGDAFAANYIGESYLQGRHVPADPVQATAWLTYAAALGSGDAARTLASDRITGTSRTPAEILRWETLSQALDFSDHLLQPPRRLTGQRLDVSPIRPQLEAAATTFASFRNKKPATLSDSAAQEQESRHRAASDEFKKNPLNGLVLLAKVVAEDNVHATRDLARILARGEYNLQPAPDLARHFHTLILGDLERAAEYGDSFAAHRLGRYALAGLNGTPDLPAGLRWLTYAAELGNSDSAAYLARLYTEGIPGLAPDPQKAAHWTAFEEQTAGDNFKPRRPLKS